MNTYKMSEDAIFNLACAIIDSVEDLLPSSLTSSEISYELENKLGYSHFHIRDIFKLSTNMTLIKYIARRKYTNILMEISSSEFTQMTMHEKISGIKSFKSKCLHEFPHLIHEYSFEHMQPVMNKTLLRNSLSRQIIKNLEADFMKSCLQDIIKGRTVYDINENCQGIIIQNHTEPFIDLDKTYFKFNDNFFKISAGVSMAEDDSTASIFSMVFNQPIYYSQTYPDNANSVIHRLHQFFTNNVPITNGLSVKLERCNKHSWGTSNLISTMTFNNNELQEVELVKNPFLIFNNENVILDLSFFERINTK